MAHDSDPFITAGVLREHRFASHTPVFGPLIARLRFVWYSVAARWGDQSIITQQTAYNQANSQRIAELDRRIEERIEERIAELDQRIILADHDLTHLTRTVAELTQQVIHLQHAVAALQAHPDHLQDRRE